VNNDNNRNSINEQLNVNRNGNSNANNNGNNNDIGPVIPLSDLTERADDKFKRPVPRYAVYTTEGDGPGFGTRVVRAKSVGVAAKKLRREDTTLGTQFWVSMYDPMFHTGGRARERIFYKVQVTHLKTNGQRIKALVEKYGICPAQPGQSRVPKLKGLPRDASNAGSLTARVVKGPLRIHVPAGMDLPDVRPAPARG
jgi:hypothetical protein